MDAKDINIQSLPRGISDPRFEQRESGRAHSSYAKEKLFYGHIKRGDVSAVEQALKDNFMGGLVIGRMSDDSIRQARYFAVSCIAVAVRAAIEGGLDESAAYNMSDACIQAVDRLDTLGEVAEYLSGSALELTEAVAEARQKHGYPEPVKICIAYIDRHLHDKITLSELAKVCGLSEDYLSALFKKTAGVALSRYILKEKLAAAKELLGGKFDCKGLGYYFAFCTESYFISCFKREYGMTPREYVKSLKY